MEKKICSICGKEFEGWGNNAWPINDGICCDECGSTTVLIARLADADALDTIKELNFETAEEGIEQLRSLRTEGIISEEKYDYILSNWDRLIGVSR